MFGYLSWKIQCSSAFLPYLAPGLPKRFRYKLLNMHLNCGGCDAVVFLSYSAWVFHGKSGLHLAHCTGAQWYCDIAVFTHRGL